MHTSQQNFTKPRRRRSFAPPVLQALFFVAAAAVLGFSTMVIAVSAI